MSLLKRDAKKRIQKDAPFECENLQQRGQQAAG